MGLLSRRQSEQKKTARRIASGGGFVVGSAEAPRFYGTDRPLPGSTTSMTTSELQTNPVTDAEQNLHTFLETDPYIQSLESIGADERVIRISAHAAIESALDEHFADKD